MRLRQRDEAALFALLRAKQRGVSWASIAADVTVAGSAETVLRGSDGGLFPSPDVEAALRHETIEIDRWRAAGLEFVTVLDDNYPSRLRDIRELPPFLFYRGELRPEDEGVSVVGSRDASDWGVRFAADAARLLVRERLTVISGLAAGIDASAHRATLDADGRTVAFIGTGITKSYPTANSALQREIGERGLLLSQFYPDAPPTKQSFPIRNAAMSGYGIATIVVEAGEHSGARIQARVAGEHGRPVVLTHRVATSTTWGRALVGSPNVYVVHSVDDLPGVISEVREAPKRLRRAIADLAAS